MIVFKQSYRSRLSPGTPGLNVRHLQYIATRPGVVKNQGCGFGLWGSFEGAAPETILDFEGEKNRLRAVSEERTVYRAILSVGKQDAEEKHLYDRANWERLLEAQVGVIAKELNIRREHFCWYASMHYAKGHPHVHLLYWDSGTDPRPEAIPKERFQIMAEHVRASFSRELYGEEIQTQRDQQQEEQKALREQVQALCLEANPETGLNLQRISSGGTADEIGQGLVKILQELPAQGSLDYKYLPPRCKALVDALIDRCLEIPELREAARRYCTSTNAISKLYGNGKETADHNLAKAQDTLHRALASEVMDRIKALANEVRADRPVCREGLQDMALKTAEAARKSEQYQALLAQMPMDRLPHRVLREFYPELTENMNAYVSEICQDFRISARVQALADAELQKAGLADVVKTGLDMKKAVFWDYRQAVADRVYLSLRQAADSDAAAKVEAVVTAAKAAPEYQALLSQIHSHLDYQLIYYAKDPAVKETLRKLVPWNPDWATSQEQQLAILAALRQDARLEQPGQAELLGAIRESPEYAALLRDESFQQPSTYKGRKELLAGIMPQIREAMSTEVRQTLRETAEAQIRDTGLEEQIQEAKELEKDVRKEYRQALRWELWQDLREDAGWNQEQARTEGETTAVSMLSVVSRLAAQQEAIEAQARRRLLGPSRDKSRAAKMDWRHRQEMGGGDHSVPELE